LFELYIIHLAIKTNQI